MGRLKALSSTYGMQQVLAATVTQLNTPLGYASKVGNAASAGNQAFATSNVAQLRENRDGVTASGPLGVGNLCNKTMTGLSYRRRSCG